MARWRAAKPMADKYSGPYKVLEWGNKVWNIWVGERVDVVSRDRLKPHLGSMAPKAAVPLRRGRPRMTSVVSVASASVAAKPGGHMCVVEPGLKSLGKFVKCKNSQELYQ